MNKTCALFYLFLFLGNVLFAQEGNKTTILYSSGSYIPKKTELEKLKPLVKKLQEQTKLQIKITGFCDDTGDDNLNDSLSVKRARYLATYLNQLGIKKDRIIQLSGKGEVSVLASDAKTIEQQRKLNRRVELLVFEPRNQKAIYKKNLNDKDLDIGDIVILEGLLFIGGRTVLLPASVLLLDSITNILKARKEYGILIKGHVNNPTPPFPDGDDIDTGLPNLSVARAKKVYDHFVNNGISPARLSFVGMKGLYPIVMDRNIGDVNRRVEIQIKKISKLDRGSGWEQIIERTKRQNEIDEAKINKPLKKQLDSILRNDQKNREQLDLIVSKFGNDSKEADEIWQKTMIQDSINLIQIKQILKRHGWPSPDEVGYSGAITPFLVIQHSTIKEQLYYLPMMQEAVKMHKISAAELALLTDRIALGQGKKQVYGSQIEFDPVHKIYKISPLVDPDHVDQRRAAVGLEPLANYALYWNIKWDPIQYKKDQKK